MNKITELMDKRAKAWQLAKDFLDSKQKLGDTLSAEDNATYEKMEADVVALGKEIDRLTRQKAIDDELSKPTTEPILNKPSANVLKNEYSTAFWDMMRARKGYSISNALKEKSDADGGYLVPDEYEKTLIEALQEENIFRKLATTIQTSSGDRKIPVVATKGTAAWVDEEGAIPESNDTFSQATIGAYKLSTLIKVSEELLSDSVFDLPSYIAKEFARRIGTAEEQAFITGNGTGKPTGVITTAQVGLTTTSSLAITLDDIMDLYYSLKAPYRNKSSFILNDTTIKAIRKLKDNNGQYLWQPSIKEGTPDTLLNRPLYTSSFMDNIEASKKPVVFGDFSYYWIADRQGINFKQLNELYAPTGQIGFVGTERVDGKLILPEAVKTLQMGGSN